MNNKQKPFGDCDDAEYRARREQLLQVSAKEMGSCITHPKSQALGHHCINPMLDAGSRRQPIRTMGETEMRASSLYLNHFVRPVVVPTTRRGRFKLWLDDKIRHVRWQVRRTWTRITCFFH